ncbi:two component transcriptional regulator, LytTR family [Butyrivibrio hungatei]|uniref:Stage 0 sporulation protein A homolog n=1 Tax=Butyrivibrio hungatei TaxID=185008 RepID=A0A1G5ADZ9_9FIRM|nr:LytTR family DNA-binding domain-containing protein [Butyrivibrio hungatei]SCX76094.1 two component transcriptional regulator, LytTR family [Butyrivibrio hungatei]
MKKTVIGICDDELQICKIIEKKIRTILHKLYGDDDEYFDIRVYCSAKDLLEKIENIDIVFLDVEMPEMDGMEAGKIIFERNPECRIIIATSNEKRYSEAFRFYAHRYLNKPLQQEEIREAIVSAVSRTVGNSTIEVYQNKIKYNIAQNEIYYIRSYNGYIQIYTANDVFTKNMSLEQIEKELDNRLFFRIHRQYIVGFKNISGFFKNIVKLINGEELEISRRNRIKFERAYVEYDLSFGD